MNYLIKDTTKEERILIVNKALAISLSDASYPSDYAIKLAQEYIDGNMELKEVQKLIVEKYKKERIDDIYE